MSENRKGVLAVVSGFSGVGKGTVISRLMEKYPDRYRLSVSATTRNPRPGETDGVQYFFVKKERFEEMIDAGLLLEYATYVDNYYGTPLEYVRQQLDLGYDVLLEIEQQGAFKVKKKIPQAPLIFIAPPDAAELERRLRSRKTETEDLILSRLARAREEAKSIDRYDYFMVNDDADKCAAQLHAAIQTEHRRVQRNIDEIKALQTDLGM